jgi:molecular chaperone Hsp33
MMHNDQVQRFLFEQSDVRGIIVRLDDSLQHIMQQHQYPEVIHALLAETLMASVLMFATLKFKGRLIIQLQNQGPISLLVAKCNDQYHISGLAQWDSEQEIASIEKTLDHGKLVVTLLRDNNVKPYQSIISLEQQTIAGALEDYFTQSEQLPTKFWVTSNGQEGVGLLLQLLPNNDAASIQDFYLETAKFADQDITEHFITLPTEELIKKLFPTKDIRLFDAEPVTFQCECSLQRMQNAIRTLGAAECHDILKDKPEIVVTCEFCSEHYGFNRDDVDTILQGENNDQ